MSVFGQPLSCSNGSIEDFDGEHDAIYIAEVVVGVAHIGRNVCKVELFQHRWLGQLGLGGWASCSCRTTKRTSPGFFEDTIL